MLKADGSIRTYITSIYSYVAARKLAKPMQVAG